MSDGRLRLLAVPALGVIFGDIGTSPLYTLRECFAYTGLPLTPDSLLAVLSLIFWSLTIVVSVKYVLTLLRFDYRGEGGVLAMLSLILRNVRRTPWLATAAMALGAFAAALFFGDAMITPAIPVLAANLAAAYGLAVSAHLVIGTVLFTVAAISRGNRRSRHDAQASAADVGRLAAIPRAAWLLLLPLGSYLVVEPAFLAANLRKLTMAAGSRCWWPSPSPSSCGSGAAASIRCAPAGIWGRAG